MGDLVKFEETSIDKDIADVEKMNKLCAKLMETKHYAKIGTEGIFAIVQKAKTLNLNSIDALNGALYFVQGRVEMGSQTMNELIRRAGHSISKDEKSDNTICILHGKRRDNGDVWTESFSLEEAKAAGLLRGGAWSKYPRDMLFARALSRLARQLFSDVIKGVYTDGELVDFKESPQIEAAYFEPSPKIEAETAKALLDLCGGDEAIKQQISNFLKKQNVESIEQLPLEWADRLEKSILKQVEDRVIVEEAKNLMVEVETLPVDPIEEEEMPAIKEWLEEEEK